MRDRRVLRINFILPLTAASVELSDRSCRGVAHWLLVSGEQPVKEEYSNAKC